MAPANLPTTFFGDNFGVKNSDLEKVLDTALAKKADYADLYFEYRQNEGVSLEEGLVKNCSQSTANGVGVRVLADAKTGYAYTDDITIQNLELAARTAHYIAQNRPSAAPVPVGPQRSEAHDLYPIKTPVNDVALEKKVELLYDIDRFARGLDNRVKNVFVSLGSEHKVILVASSQGLVVGDIQPLTRLNVTCIVEEGGNRQIGSFGGGGRVEFGFFVDNKDWQRYAREAVRQAILNLTAIDAPAGTMDVVLGSGWPGILLHEAIGHGLEGDFNRKKTSAFSDRIGQKVASELCTVVDDGTIPSRRGSINVDDEGTPTHHTVLIENGILKGYLQDKLKEGKINRISGGRRSSCVSSISSLLLSPLLYSTPLTTAPLTSEEIQSIDYAGSLGPPSFYSLPCALTTIPTVNDLSLQVRAIIALIIVFAGLALYIL